MVMSPKTSVSKAIDAFKMGQLSRRHRPDDRWQDDAWKEKKLAKETI
jgi:hypothetical protein